MTTKSTSKSTTKSASTSESVEQDKTNDKETKDVTSETKAKNTDISNISTKTDTAPDELRYNPKIKESKDIAEKVVKAHNERLNKVPKPKEVSKSSK